MDSRVDGLQAILGQGVSICFMCADAIAVYHDAQARGLNPSRPFVGNNLWVTSLTDPDGIAGLREPTDVPRESEYRRMTPTISGITPFFIVANRPGNALVLITICWVLKLPFEANS
jgi:hypothetical protein